MLSWLEPLARLLTIQDFHESTLSCLPILHMSAVTHLICIGDLKSVLNESMPIRMLSGERIIKEANDSVHLGKGKAPSKQAVGYPRK